MGNSKGYAFLRLCPFCGGIARVCDREIWGSKFYFVKCPSCGARTRNAGVGKAFFPQLHDVSDAEAKNEVISLWNSRYKKA